jgi:hypothetical protein
MNSTLFTGLKTQTGTGAKQTLKTPTTDAKKESHDQARMGLEATP